MKTEQSEETPLIRQYRAIRATLPAGTILLFRLGDFYEIFGDDAKEAAKTLVIAITSRKGVPMCGIPHHSHGRYTRQLLDAGKTVAICEILSAK